MDTLEQNGISNDIQVPELPDLVWHLIIQLLSENSRSTVLSVSASSQRLYMLAVPTLYRSITLSTREKTQNLLLRLAKDDTCLTKFIQEVTIQYGDWIDNLIVQQLSKIFSATTQLRTLKWTGHYDIPDRILLSIQKASPDARIMVKGDVPYGYHQDGSIDCTGTSSLNLYSLHAGIDARPEVERNAKLAVYHTLRGSPNLRKLEMEKYSGGCVMYGYNPDLEVELEVRVGEKLPRLEELSYPIFAHDDIIRWGQMGGWSRLRVLKLSRYSPYIEAFVGRMPSLRSLTLKLSWDDIKHSEQHLARITGLEELVLSGTGMEFPFDLLANNGDTLTTLKVHAPEPYDPARRPDVPLSTLQRLNETCPNLKSLAVDINREGAWPYEYLEELAKFPHVTHLTLMAEGMRGSGTPVLPIIDDTCCKTIFKHLLAQKTGPAKLQRLTIERGGMGPWGGGLPANEVMQESHYATVFDYAADSEGNISGGEKENWASQARAFMAGHRSLFESDLWAEPPSSLTIEELSFLARKLDLAMAEHELGRQGLLCDTDEDLIEAGTDKDRCEGLKVMVSRFGEYSNATKKKWMKRAEKLLTKKMSVRAMEKMFTKECTLYDIYSDRYKTESA